MLFMVLNNTNLVKTYNISTVHSPKLFNSLKDLLISIRIT